MFSVNSNAFEAVLNSRQLGGPGGSGVGQVLRGGYDVRTILSAGPETDAEIAKVWLTVAPVHTLEDLL